MLRTASAIFTSASRTTPAAAAARVRRSGAPIFSSIARTAPARSSGIVPPRNRAASIRPSTRFASVTVGSWPPRAYDTGPGSAPALCGPSASAPPASIQAMVPPPALTSLMSITGIRSGRPSTWYSSVARTRPRSTIAHLAVVPPMSNEITWSAPRICARLAQPVAPAERLPEGAQVAIHDRLDVRVDYRRAGPLVLSPLLGDAVRDRHRGAGQLRRHDLRGAPLVGRVPVREEEDHGHRLDAFRRELPGGSSDGALVEGHEHLAPRRQALHHLQASPPRHERRGPAVEDVVHPQEVAATDLEDVPEALCRDEAGSRPLALEERIDTDGGAVDDEATVGKTRARLVDAAKDAPQQVGRCAERLGVDDRTGCLVQRHQVREGAADVDTDPECHANAPRPVAGPAITSEFPRILRASIGRSPGSRNLRPASAWQQTHSAKARGKSGQARGLPHLPAAAGRAGATRSGHRTSRRSHR